MHSALNLRAGIVFAVVFLECEVTADRVQEWRKLEEKSQSVYWNGRIGTVLEMSYSWNKSIIF